VAFRDFHLVPISHRPLGDYKEVRWLVIVHWELFEASLVGLYTF
jgi:hypothetical protein